VSSEQSHIDTPTDELRARRVVIDELRRDDFSEGLT
jgi:hypothetical protein